MFSGFCFFIVTMERFEPINFIYNLFTQNLQYQNPPNHFSAKKKNRN